MRRTLTRPMFRRGGQARQGYNPGGPVNLKDILATEEDMNLYRSQMPEQAPDRSLNDFLINFGLDLISRPPTGNIFQTAAQSAKEPFNQMQKVRYSQEQGERDEAKDMITAIMNAKAAVAGSEGVSNAQGKAANDIAINGIMTELFTLKGNQKNPETAIDQESFDQQQSTLMTRLTAYVGKNAAVQSLFGNKAQAEIVIAGIQEQITSSPEEITIINAQGEEEVVIEGEYAQSNPGYLGKKTTEIYLKQFADAQKQALGLGQANGGRINKAVGGMMEETMTEEVAGPGGMAMESETIEEAVAPEPTDQGSGLSFEELRQRLPAEITDDIISILAESPAALVDFAEIQTQIDVDQFNMKYGVNLVLPSGA